MESVRTRWQAATLWSLLSVALCGTLVVWGFTVGGILAPRHPAPVSDIYQFTSNSDSYLAPRPLGGVLSTSQPKCQLIVGDSPGQTVYLSATTGTVLTPSEVKNC